MLASLCWCYTDEARDVAQSEFVPMKWETAPFLHSSALLDHIHTCAMPHVSFFIYLQMGWMLRNTYAGMS